MNSTARASKVIDADVDGKLYEGILLKLEYVKQTTSGFAAGMTNNGVDLGLNPEFSGFSIETAIKF